MGGVVCQEVPGKVQDGGSSGFPQKTDWSFKQLLRLKVHPLSWKQRVRVVEHHILLLQLLTS